MNGCDQFLHMEHETNLRRWNLDGQRLLMSSLLFVLLRVDVFDVICLQTTFQNVKVCFICWSHLTLAWSINNYESQKNSYLSQFERILKFWTFGLLRFSWADRSIRFHCTWILWETCEFSVKTWMLWFFLNDEKIKYLCSDVQFI